MFLLGVINQVKLDHILGKLAFCFIKRLLTTHVIYSAISLKFSLSEFLICDLSLVLQSGIRALMLYQCLSTTMAYMDCVGCGLSHTNNNLIKKFHSIFSLFVII